MLDTYRCRSAGTWHAYIRMEGSRHFNEAIQRRSDVVVLEPMMRQPYGDTEFVVKDPSGHVLVFSELISTRA